MEREFGENRLSGRLIAWPTLIFPGSAMVEQVKQRDHTKDVVWRLEAHSRTCIKATEAGQAGIAK